MVDVTAKQPTVREATAEAFVACSAPVVHTAKGKPLARTVASVRSTSRRWTSAAAS